MSLNERASLIFLSKRSSVWFLTQKGCDIRDCWIPNHPGIKGNDLAAAKSEAYSLNISIPFIDLKNVVKSIVRCQWQELWMM
ncbi:hypothetical protein NPIL_86701 [Nephila pilipes]|uniref:RNase H type-1 domain-containing protein n=1 Tax=Nephila pilipes TaxID=299642 RepID=A0A8X6PUC8_NEPPI|nr:hypothetical protein NPIL_86701 [Nephila pilipes]